MSDYLRVSVPADFPVKAIDSSKQSVREKVSTVYAGDLIALANAGVNDETLWVVVLSKNENNGSSDICIAYPEQSLAVGSDVIVEKDAANNSFEFCIWPQVVATVWTDDLVGGERHGKISDEALQHVRHLSMPGAKPASDLVLSKGIRFGVDGVTPTLSYLKFRGTTAEVLDRFAKPWWSLLENNFVARDFIMAGVTGNNEFAATYLTSKTVDYRVLPLDLEATLIDLKTLGLGTLMRGRKFNSLAQNIYKSSQGVAAISFSDNEDETIRRASEILGSFTLQTVAKESSPLRTIKVDRNRVQVSSNGDGYGV
jgi:hypothetical protein